MCRKVVVSWSGGKDSSLALTALLADARYQVVGLLTSITTGYDRVSIHGVRRQLVEAQTAAIGLPLFEMMLEPLTSNAAYEAGFLRALVTVRLAIPEVEHIAFGDLYLEDVRSYRERLLGGTGFEPLFPIWGRDTRQLATDFVRAGFRARVVCVDTTQLPAAFAGRSFDERFLADLPEQADPCGEGGEFHTFVSDGPPFQRPVAVHVGETILRDRRFAYTDLTLDEMAAGEASCRPHT